MDAGLITFLAPLSLLLGAGLFVIGLFSVFGLHFLKSQSAERAALAGGLALIVLAELLLAASGMRFLNGQRGDLLECRLEAETELPNERHKNSPVIHARILRCMEGFGYEWTTGQRRCREAPVSTNPFCYLPKRLFDRVMTEAQMMAQ
jgi:hypothetical protein